VAAVNAPVLSGPGLKDQAYQHWGGAVAVAAGDGDPEADAAGGGDQRCPLQSEVMMLEPCLLPKVSSINAIQLINWPRVAIGGSGRLGGLGSFAQRASRRFITARDTCAVRQVRRSAHRTPRGV